MTKNVRVENADTNTNVKVVVEVWDKFGDSEPVLSQSYLLANPTDMTPPGVYLTNTRYLVVKEVQ